MPNKLIDVNRALDSKTNFSQWLKWNGQDRKKKLSETERQKNINPLMVLSFKTFQNMLTGKMAINMSEPFKTLHNFLLLHYHTFQNPSKGFER